jgi:hypothetical protein
MKHGLNTGFYGGRDAALRRPRPTGRNKRGKSSVIPSPDAALGDEDSAARCPYLIEFVLIGEIRVCILARSENA